MLINDVVVTKKDGSFEKFNQNKLIEAALKSASRTNLPMSEQEIRLFVNSAEDLVVDLFDQDEFISVETLHEIAEESLDLVRQDVANEYKRFRNYKKEMKDSMQSIKNESDSIKFDVITENAHKDSDVISTKRALLAEKTMKELVLMFELKPEWAKAHKEGWLYIHDLGDRWTQSHNCCLFDAGNVIKHKPEKGYAFKLNNIEHQEPKEVETAISVIVDLVLSASSQQYGGFTIPEIDSIIAPYAEKTYNNKVTYFADKLGVGHYELAKELAYNETIRQLKQGYQALEHRLNTLSNALGQAPFVSISFGIETSFWGREFTKIILQTRKENKNFVFPKLIFLTKKNINRDKDSVNYPLYKLALETSRTRLYPDYLSLEPTGTVGQTFDRCGKVISPMGCRSYLSRFNHPETGEEIYIGRANVSVVSVHLVKIALESKGSLSRFYELLEKYTKMALDINQWYHGQVSKLKGSSNPLFWCEGGAWMSVEPNESVAPIVKAFTTSVGFVGLNQAINALNLDSYKSITLDDRQKIGLEIISTMRNWVDQRKEEDGILHSLYATPAESLCFKWNELIRDQYGIIDGVSDKQFQTNSFHIDVWEHISAPAKISYEAPFHNIASGGKIGYVEFPYGVAVSTLEATVNYAMDHGMYFGINIISANCEDCGEAGDFIETCPNCGSDNIIAINRVCGYLSVVSKGGQFRQNPGKIAETFMRVDHAGFGNKEVKSYLESKG